MSYAEHRARCARLGARPLTYLGWLRLRDWIEFGRRAG